MKIAKTTVFTSLIWTVLQKFGTRGIQFILQLILARLLLPEDYGIIAIVNVFILFANVFVQSGLSTALVQKKNADKLDFSTVFVATLIVASLLYLLLFNLAPIIAQFFRMNELISVIRVLSIIIFFSAINSVQQAYIQKHMLFKKLFLYSLCSVFISGVIGVVLAYQGFGVWALVFQQIINQAILSIILFVGIEWKPTFKFSLMRLKSLFSFGWKVLLSSIITTLYVDIRTIAIGRFFSPDLLGYYNKGQQFPKLAVDNIVSSIQAVMFPAFSSQQDNKKVLKSMMGKSISMSLYIVAPMMVGLIVVAENLVLVILTETWIQAVPFLQIYCIVYLFKPIFVTNLQSINSVGRSDIFLKMEALKTILGTLILIVSIPFGVYAIALGSIINSVFSLFIYTYPNKKLINYGLLEQLKSMTIPIILSVTMGVLIYFFNFLSINRLSILILQVIGGLIIYIALSVLFKVESFYYLLNIINDLKVKKFESKPMRG